MPASAQRPIRGTRHNLNRKAIPMEEFAEFLRLMNQQLVHGVGNFQARVQQLVEQLQRDEWLRLRGSYVCVATEGILGGALAWLGYGFPERAEGLAGTGSRFGAVSAQIAGLGPEAGWQGSAARAYGAQNRAQSERATLMSNLDRHIADLVTAQAEDVQAVRSVVTGEMVAVAGLCALCLYCESLGPLGHEVSLAIALTACGVLLAITIGFLIDLAVTTSRNAGDLRAAEQKLTAMLAALPQWREAIGSSNMAFPLPYSPREAPAATPVERTVDAALGFAQLPGAPGFRLPTVASPGFPDFGAPHLPIPRLTGMPTLPDALPTMLSTNELATRPGLSGALAALARPAQQLVSDAAAGNATPARTPVPAPASECASGQNHHQLQQPQQRWTREVSSTHGV